MKNALLFETYVSISNLDIRNTYCWTRLARLLTNLKFFRKKVLKSFSCSNKIVIFTYNLKTTNKMKDLMTQVHEVAMTRLMIDMETSLLLNIKSNLTKLTTEEIHGVDEMAKQIILSTWVAEIENINLELIRRN